MEQIPTITPEPTENVPEKRDRFIEFMERRHRNALAVLEIEDTLSQEVILNEYPTTSSIENKSIKQKAMDAASPIIKSLSEAGLIVKESNVKEAIDRYVMQKISAQRAEISLREILEDKSKKPNPEEAGAEIFTQTTRKAPLGLVWAERKEGYFIVSFEEDEDYISFWGMGQSERRSEAENSAGFFHRAKHFSNIPMQSMDIIAIRGPRNYSVLDHERQHFINHSIFNLFHGIEMHNTESKKGKFPSLTESTATNNQVGLSLRLIKDEVLAYIRDGSGAERVTGFFENALYSHLGKYFSKEEHKEVV